jgi:hypothetical protein
LKNLKRIYLYLADFVWKTCIYLDSNDILKWIYMPNIGQDSKGPLWARYCFDEKEKKKKEHIHLLACIVATSSQILEHQKD